MFKVNAPSDCGNAPKKKILLDFNIAFANADVDAIVRYLSDDIVWEIVGDKTIKGISDVKASLDEMAAYRAEELSLFQIITHGKEASAHGFFRFKDQNVAFADFYTFTSAGSSKIKHLTSYIVKI